MLVSLLQRAGERLGLPEALPGLAADAPEVTAAITAMAGHQQPPGARVVIQRVQARPPCRGLAPSPPGGSGCTAGS